MGSTCHGQIRPARSPQGVPWVRDRALLEVLYSTGIRRGELIALMVSDVNLQNRVVFVREGKGGKDRLSIRQPWAELILSGKKPIEYRTWTTDYRGPVLLHAGAARDRSTRDLISECIDEGDLDESTTLAFGGMVGAFELLDVQESEEHEGHYEWHVRPLARLPLVPIKGKPTLPSLMMDNASVAVHSWLRSSWAKNPSRSLSASASLSALTTSRW